MSRKCFLEDNDGHIYAVNVDRKGFFYDFMNKTSKSFEEDDEYWEALDQFEEEFGDDRLGMHLSNYSFDNLQEMD